MTDPTVKNRAMAIIAQDRVARRYAPSSVAPPGQAITPTQSFGVDQAGRPQPRQFPFPAGVNQIIIPRREYPDLTPFQQLRGLAANYDVAALAIATRIEELQAINWAVAPRDKKAAPDDLCLEIEAFFQKPDKTNDFATWMGMLLYEQYTTDTWTMYRRTDQGGRLYSLDVVDGTTIKPLLDNIGRVVAYQQIMYGMVSGNYGLMPPGQDGEIMLPSELYYRPRWLRAYTPYGFPPTEWVVLRVNTALRKQAFDLAYFTEGNIPEMFANPPEGLLDPEQVAAFEESFNAVLTGNTAARRKVRFFPWPLEAKELKSFSFDTALDKWLLGITAAAFGVTPSEMGFTDDVNRATAQHQSAVNQRRGQGPAMRWVKGVLDEIIREEFQAPHLEWSWVLEEDKGDYSANAAADKTYVDMGALSADEVRQMRFKGQVEGPAPGSPATASPTSAPSANTALPPPAPPEPSQAPPASSQPGPLPEPDAQKRSSLGTFAKGDEHAGVIFSLTLRPEDASRIASEIGWSGPTDEWHVTLVYMPGRPDFDQLHDIAVSLAPLLPPLDLCLNGVGRFIGEEEDPLHLLIDCPELPAFRQAIFDACRDARLDVGMDHGFTPHMTLAYLPKDAPTPNLPLRRDIGWRATTLDIMYGEAVHSFPLGEALIVKASGIEEEEEEVAWDEDERLALEDEMTKALEAYFSQKIKQVLTNDEILAGDQG